MAKFKLYIEGPEKKEIPLEKELSIGRSDLADLIIKDDGLSRINSTFEIQGDSLWVFDENSTNGTFVNGERIKEKKLQNGDEIEVGNETRIIVEIAREEKNEPPAISIPLEPPGSKKVIPKINKDEPREKAPFAIIAAIASIFFIIIAATAAILLVNNFGGISGNSNAKPTPRILASAAIPLRVIDPLGGEDPDDLDDLISSWEVEDAPLDVADIGEVTSTIADPDSSNPSSASELQVSPAIWAKQRELAFAPRSSAVGTDPGGTIVPRELFGDGVIKQKRKLAEMVSSLNYQQPMDFSDLASKRISRELIELPMATDWYFLDVGGSASEGEFTAFDFDTGNTPIAENSPKFAPIKQLAGNFDGQKYDLSNPRDRKQMRIRLLRMFNQRAKPILERLAKAYQGKFKRPLRVTSLTRSMDYQIGLNKTNANSFKVSGKGSLPPHTSGCAFDLARKHMTAEEQNFVMAELAKMENEGLLDALREGGANACFHVFIYADGRPPK